MLSWGFFAVVKNCDKLNFRGGVGGSSVVSTLCVSLHRHRFGGWRVPHFHEHVSRGGKNVVFFVLFVCLFLLSSQLLEFEQFCSTFILGLSSAATIFASSPNGDCMHQSSL